ncbi:MAG: hypothetical protein IKC71_03140 [Clostridia bacterium]|nr:hypothetical protein [Clostridia bacterium]
MSKKKAKALLSIIIALIVVLCVMTFAKFEIPGIKNGVYNYNSILGALELDADLEESAAYTLKLKDDISSEDEEVEVESILKVLESRIIGLGYDNYAISTLKNSTTDNYDIRIELPNKQSTASDITAIIAYGEMEVTDADGNVILTGNGAIKNVKVESYEAYDQMNNKVLAYACIVEFTEEAFEEIKAVLPTTVNIKVGETSLFSQELNVEDFLQRTISISNYGTDKSAAERAALQLKTGGIPYEYEIEKGEVISPLMGENAGLISLLILAGLVLIAIILFAVKYKGFALSSLISVLAFMLIELIILVLIPALKISFASILGFIVATIFVLSGLFTQAQKTLAEFDSGKTFKAALKSAYKKGGLLFVDVSVILAILSLAVFFIANGAIRSFAITFGVGTVVALFVVAVFSKWIIKLFYHSVSKKEAFFKLNREDAE